jgi:hypothetical protein
MKVIRPEDHTKHIHTLHAPNSDISISKKLQILFDGGKRTKWAALCVAKLEL